MDKRSFLNYYKTILEKVSFDKKLLEKEYKKAKRLLEGPEAKDLDYWVNSNGLAHKIGTFSMNRKSERIN
ncbi:hypothetical protein [Algoriphagus aquimarinus]|uniref:Uncharacterized protein n=1 Tax=Algoriphagus aquimarinus TaxID=237018 RepID=A0A1I1AQX4_9BACT|nr:hypothetical protein [Algoriphagus aquimarinus]SFB40435.1 hypothetical protein SAMN04489723_10954 [Algoriphagus aquimarinus]